MTDETISTRNPNHIRLALAAVGLIAAGGIAGGVASRTMQPPIEMAPLHAVAIRTLPSASGIVTIRGRVAETYGNKFVIDDGSARTLVDTGRVGDETALVADGNAVTVQGRFDRGFVHASFLVDAAGKVTALAPVGPPHDHRGPPRGPGEAGPPPPPGGPAVAPPPPPGNAPVAPPAAD